MFDKLSQNLNELRLLSEIFEKSTKDEEIKEIEDGGDDWDRRDQEEDVDYDLD